MHTTEPYQGMEAEATLRPTTRANTRHLPSLLVRRPAIRSHGSLSYLPSLTTKRDRPSGPNTGLATPSYTPSTTAP